MLLSTKTPNERWTSSSHLSSWLRIQHTLHWVPPWMEVVAAISVGGFIAACKSHSFTHSSHLVSRRPNAVSTTEWTSQISKNSTWMLNVFIGSPNEILNLGERWNISTVALALPLRGFCRLLGHHFSRSRICKWDFIDVFYSIVRSIVWPHKTMQQWYGS